jgi:hypothetical protein
MHKTFIAVIRILFSMSLEWSVFLVALPDHVHMYNCIGLDRRPPEAEGCEDSDRQEVLPVYRYVQLYWAGSPFHLKQRGVRTVIVRKCYQFIGMYNVHAATSCNILSICIGDGSEVHGFQSRGVFRGLNYPTSHS